MALLLNFPWIKLPLLPCLQHYAALAAHARTILGDFLGLDDPIAINAMIEAIFYCYFSHWDEFEQEQGHAKRMSKQSINKSQKM